MGNLTFGGMKTELAMLLRDRTDTVVDDTRLGRWINWAYFHVCHPGVFRHREVMTNYDITLVTNDIDYDISKATLTYHMTGIRSVIHYISTTVVPTANKNRINPTALHQLEDRTYSTGPPDRFAVDGTQLILDTIPTSVENGQQLRLRVFREPLILSDTGDTSVIPTIWDEIILLGAQWRAERDLGYLDRAELTKQNYASLINEYTETPQIEAEENIGWMTPIERVEVMRR